MQINGYLYDTHVHTSEGSACGQNTGAEMARAYQKAGYAGIVVTDHFFYGNTAADRSLPWKDWVEQFCKGYEHAKEEGDKIGLQVFFGWESGYHGTEFLIYGLNKEWLFEHPEIKDADVKEQYELVHAGGGIVSHAHPFREEDYIPEIRLFPDMLDFEQPGGQQRQQQQHADHAGREWNWQRRLNELAEPAHGKDDADLTDDFHGNTPPVLHIKTIVAPISLPVNQLPPPVEAVDKPFRQRFRRE